ncbi:TPA: hypothetical protein ACX6PX_003805 [Photobacterium damselae]|uniref:Uncharacterized protein n=1 Tax=Photobacterium damselae subsp. damselae TaxID=85581 RepID=A0A850QM43_PHODD|nr:hypothetical protein [Photobacterium damselae subsp. damselae]
MSLCLVVDGNNQVSAELTTPSACTGYLVPSATEYQAMNDLTLQFNSEVFNSVLGWLLVTFVVGHSTGRIVRYLGKK